ADRRSGAVRARARAVSRRAEGRDPALPRQGGLEDPRRRPVRSQRGLQRHRVRAPRARHPSGEVQRERRRRRAGPPHRRLRGAVARDAALRAAGPRQAARRRVSLLGRRRGGRPRRRAGLMAEPAVTAAESGFDLTLTDEQEQIQRTARAFAFEKVLPRAADIDEQARIPRELISEMGALGFMGICVPEPYGGSELDVLTYVLVAEE